MLKKSRTEFYYGRDLQGIPLVDIAEPTGEIAAAFTGPNAGLTALDPNTRTLLGDVAIAGCNDWNQPSEYAYGIAISLYEEDRSNGSPANPVVVGEPIADVFGVQVRENIAVLAIADGVNWGVKPRLAARCAVRAVMEHVMANLGRVQENPTSHAICSLLVESVTLKAQELILEHNATLTTLSSAVVCEMKRPGEWGLFVVAVGDSPVYVYCPHSREVVEATVGCHPHDGDRDVKMAGGTLGPSYGSKPDLENLTVAFMKVYEGDIIFCTSDGISDNFSGKAVAQMTGKEYPDVNHKLMPCCDSILHMTEILSKHQEELQESMTAQTVTACLVNYAAEFTQQKRLFHSHCTEHSISMQRRKREDPDFAEKLRLLPGKLDHAAVVAFQVGKHSKKLSLLR